MTEALYARLFLALILIVFIIWCIQKYKRKKEHASRKWTFNGISNFDTSVFYSVKKPLNRNSSNHSPKSGKCGKKINKTEEKCRKILQNLFHKPFPSVRPNFLRSPKTGKNLELDCYNEQLKLAVEYNGPQHYTFTPHFQKSKKDFYSQVHRDDWKRKKCREMGIKLIEIPYWITEYNELEKFIRKKLAD